MRKTLLGLLVTTVVAFAWTIGGRAQSFSFKHLQFYGAGGVYDHAAGENLVPDFENSANLVSWQYYHDGNTPQFVASLSATKMKVILSLVISHDIFFDQNNARSAYLDAVGIELNRVHPNGLRLRDYTAFIAPDEEWFTRAYNDTLTLPEWPEFYQLGSDDWGKRFLILEHLPGLINDIKTRFGIPTIQVENVWDNGLFSVMNELTNPPQPLPIDVLGLDAYFIPTDRTPETSCSAAQQNLFVEHVTNLYNTAASNRASKSIMMYAGAFEDHGGPYRMPTPCQIRWYRDLAQEPARAEYMIGIQWYVYRDVNPDNLPILQEGFRRPAWAAQKDEIFKIGRQMVDRYRHQLLWRNNYDIKKWDVELGHLLLDSPFVTPSVDPFWQIVATGDFDGDAHQDIVWTYRGSGASQGALYVWYMDREQMRESVPVGPGAVSDLSWNLRAAADMADGDGDPDLLWQNTSTGQVSSWRMNNVTMVQGDLMTPAIVPVEWKIVGAGDLNGDGRNEIIWYNVLNGRASAWFMKPSTTGPGNKYPLEQETGPSLTPDGITDLNWKLSGVTDVDGDKKADLVWHNTADGRVLAWIMNGPVRTQEVLYDATIGSGWRITGIR
jgi:FG-GAP repeat protein/VCBS repeat protein